MIFRRASLHWLVLVAGCAGNGGDTTDKGNQGASGAGDGVGSVIVSVAPGAGVAGLAPGSKIGSISDGWTVEYDRFLVVLGDVRASPGGMLSSESLTYDDTFLIDLLRVPITGSQVATRGDLEATGYEGTEFSMLLPTERTELIESSEADGSFMLKEGLTLFVEGSMTNPGGRSCDPEDPKDCAPAPTIRFSWGLSVATNFSDCDGFNLPDDERVELVFTVPGDHWFLSNFSPDAESSARQAQWVADADLDRDGSTTLEELQSVKAPSLFTAERGYDLADAPLPIDTAYDFLAAQVATLGLNQANNCRTSAPVEDI